MSREDADFVAAHGHELEAAFNDVLRAAIRAKPNDPAAFITDFFSSGAASDAWAEQQSGSKCNIPPCPLTEETVDASVAKPTDSKRRAFIAERARDDYRQACQVFELIVASVAYDNAAVMWVVNEVSAAVPSATSHHWRSRPQRCHSPRSGP